MSTPAPIRILVVDDHQLIRVGITTLIFPESDMKVVGEASDGREAVAKYRECRPDITLMDLQMPEMGKHWPTLAPPRATSHRVGRALYNERSS